MSDFCAFIPVVNRPDLLEQCVNGLGVYPRDLTIIDNSPDSWVQDSEDYLVYTPNIPLTFAQSMNLEFKLTLSSKSKFCLHAHSDAIISNGATSKLLETAREISLSGRKWGVIYTHYDILAIYNPAAYLDIGGYDTNLPAYFSDNDWYHRLDLAGYERINTGISVGHIGSQTINSDPKLQFLNGITFPLYREYYRQKWGGEPGDELYPIPFNQELFRGSKL